MVAQLVPTPHPILGAIATARAALADVRDTQPLFMTPTEQEAALRELARLEAMTAEVKLRVVAASENAANKAGARDVGSWVACMTHADYQAGRADARLADALDRRWTRVAAGMADGDISVAQARVVVEALDALPDDLDPEIVALAEEQLVAYCADFPPSALRRLGRHLLDVVAPEIAEAELAKQLENEEQRAREKTTLRSKTIGEGMARTTITHPVVDRDRLLTYLESYTSPRKSEDAINGDEDRIPYPRRLGQAFTALLEHLDPTKLPQHGGDATTLMVTITLDSLRQQLGTGTVVGGEALSASAVRRLACNADIIPVVLGGKSEILDLGRSRRFHSPAQRKALKLLHPHCQGEGCTIPAAWCEIHHDTPWAKGGKTNLADGRVYCSWHHHRSHDPTFTTELLPNGDIRFHRRT
jgi:Domain of unknown function (DUF222)